MDNQRISQTLNQGPTLIALAVEFTTLVSVTMHLQLQLR
jgi:hypothetical protein